jgi:hypothetical protein
MTESISLWRQERAVNGRFLSMTRHRCPSGDTTFLGPLGIGLDLLSAIGQFGTWYEAHRLADASKAQFEERRVPWLNEALDQWIREHSDKAGIAVDITESLVRESDKILAKLVEIESMDVPEVLLVKAGRVADYIDDVTGVCGQIVSRLVDVSESRTEWKPEIRPSRQVVEESLRENGDSELIWPTVALGAAALLIPGVGAQVAGGLFGLAIKQHFDRGSRSKIRSRLAQYRSLLRLNVAASQLLGTTTLARRFLERQGLPEGTRLYAVSRESMEVQLVLGPERSRPWYARLFTSSRAPVLRPLAAPTD